MRERFALDCIHRHSVCRFSSLTVSPSRMYEFRGILGILRPKLPFGESRNSLVPLIRLLFSATKESTCTTALFGHENEVIRIS
jgi:hypothetical protein